MFHDNCVWIIHNNLTEQHIRMLRHTYKIHTIRSQYKQDVTCNCYWVPPWIAHAWRVQVDSQSKAIIPRTAHDARRHLSLKLSFWNYGQISLTIWVLRMFVFLWTKSIWGYSQLHRSILNTFLTKHLSRKNPRWTYILVAVQRPVTYLVMKASR